MTEEEKKKSYFDLLKHLHVPENFDYELLFVLFEEATEGAEGMKDQNPIVGSFGINPIELTMYLVYEHSFHLLMSGKDPKDVYDDEAYHQTVCSIALDKYYMPMPRSTIQASLPLPFISTSCWACSKDIKGAIRTLTSSSTS